MTNTGTTKNSAKNLKNPRSASKNPGFDSTILQGKKSFSIYGKKKGVQSRRRQLGSKMPSWLGTALSIVGVSVAVGAGLYASRRQWMPKAQEWQENFSAAYADDETDYENFDQTRHAGADSMRDHPGDDWENVDDMSDASFPASDPPSFNPGTAG
jgi:hypothetical protein